MAALLQHVRPWMQCAIEESEARIEKRVEHMMDQKVQAIHKRLDAFELRVLERPTLIVDVVTLQKEIESLCKDLTGLLAPSETEPEPASIAQVDDTVLSALFGDGMPSPDSTRTVRKRPRSSRTSDDTKAGRASKREHQKTEVARGNP
ncbi:hypothetical protein R3W88_001425 [Solanum pinnatisectum]|uniref:Integrase core domain containing protein n=1 Tax=Solanum pinnatisectum TaxID=50273 RepID=A0AAV9MJP9_9SOLN|nr:hypothetical protein R3W88_001425 [Solanum pinnatisectum]